MNTFPPISDFQAKLPGNKEPEEEIQSVIEQLLGLDLHHGLENSLLAKLQRALAALSDEDQRNRDAAISSLRSFIQEVNAQAGKKIDRTNAIYLVEVVTLIINALIND